MSRRVAVIALKLSVAVAMVWFLIATDRLSLAPVRELFGSPGTCIALVLLQLAILLLGAVRWWLVLRAIEGRSRPLARLVAYTWVGLFAGCVLPSAIATDFVRYRYLRRDDSLAAPVVLSIVVDRICGVTSLGLLVLVFSASMFVEVASVERMVILALVVLVAIALVVLVARSRHLDSARTGLRSILAHRTTSLVAIALGFAAHLLKCISLYLIVCEVAPGSLTLGELLAFAPVGFVVEALPLAPGGLGTAHLLFDYLFRVAGVAGGASLFNAYFLTRMLVNLGGGVVWLFPRRAAVLEGATRRS